MLGKDLERGCSRNLNPMFDSCLMLGFHSYDYTFLPPYPTQKESKVVHFYVFVFIIKFGWVFVWA